MARRKLKPRSKVLPKRSQAKRTTRVVSEGVKLVNRSTGEELQGELRKTWQSTTMSGWTIQHVYVEDDRHFMLQVDPSGQTNHPLWRFA